MFNLKRRNALFLIGMILIGGTLGFWKLYPFVSLNAFAKLVFILLWLFFGLLLVGGYFLVEDIYTERFVELIEFLTPEKESLEGEEVKNGDE